MKSAICASIGMALSAIASLFGGWDATMTALVICMGVDYITGCVVALVFHNSRKTESGCYHSSYGLKGLCKKCLMLLFVIVAVQADGLLGICYVRDAVSFGFCINEILSIVENLGLAGIPLPDAVKNALEQLQQKSK